MMKEFIGVPEQLYGTVCNFEYLVLQVRTKRMHRCYGSVVIYRIGVLW